MAANQTEYSKLEQKTFKEKEQTMWYLQKNVQYVWRSMFLSKKSLQMGKAWVCQYEPELKRRSIEQKHTDYTVKKKFWVQWSVKKVILIDIGHERTNHF